MNFAQIMQQAKVMQTKMAEMQAKLGDVQVTGTAGGGAVSVTMTCKGRVDEVKIAPGVIDPKDPGMLEDLIKAALNEARRRADETLAEETRRLMESMGLPGNVQLPF